MNAYELANELSEFMTEDEYTELDKTIFKAVTMLRQQADQIAELEKEVERLVGAEPITHGRLTFCKNCGQQDPYTQTKPLSDEEINQIAKDELIGWACDEDMLSFARAIEERHGIK